ncbi:methyltransferase domain-containing protein [Methylolobus aquaticus]|nr:methyltransferase domain-containing protein [Methylolobus aquaticus]
MSTVSYDIDSSHRDAASEAARLQVQATAGWTKEMRNLTGFGLRDGMAVLEVGCGPGYITGHLLKALPTSRITAIEIDAALAQQTADRLGSCDRLQIVHAALLDAELPDAGFDFAIARLVFQHLPDPVAAAVGILRMLKPGGKLVIVDSDDALWGLSDPEIPEMDAALQIYGHAQAAQGGNRRIGRALLRILEKAGFVNLDLEALLNHSDLLGLDALLPHLDPDRLLPLVAHGAMSGSTFAAFKASQMRFTEATAPLLMMLLLMACGEKPG